MKTIIGIDIGGSTTKISGIRNNEIITPMMVRATDEKTSLFGAFGKFVDFNSLDLSNIEKVMVTGVGASYIDKKIYGLKTGKVQEFLCNGLGGLHLSKIKKAVIVSMGTGTAIVSATDEKIEHMGGTGIGGGTILGLSSKILNTKDISLIIKLANLGNLKNVDLSVSDITIDKLEGLTPETTASNFGNINDLATNNDIALGILNLVLQTIGMTASFASKITEINDIVLIGSLTSIPQHKKIFEDLSNLCKVNFIVPDKSEYATSIGACLAYIKEMEYEEI